MVDDNRDWYDLVRPSSGKSVRDSIVHRLCKWNIGTRSELDKIDTKVICAELQGKDSDVSTEDGVVAARNILSGFCNFLTSIPIEAWLWKEFEGRDFITAPATKYLGGQFLPLLPKTIELSDDTQDD